MIHQSSYKTIQNEGTLDTDIGVNVRMTYKPEFRSQINLNNGRGKKGIRDIDKLPLDRSRLTD